MPLCQQRNRWGELKPAEGCGSAGSVCSVKAFRPSLGPVAIRQVIEDQGRQRIVPSSAPIEHHIRTVDISCNELRTLELAADSLCDPLHQALEPLCARGRHRKKPQSTLTV